MAYGSAPRTSTPGIMVMRKIWRIFRTSVDTFPVYRGHPMMQRANVAKSRAPQYNEKVLQAVEPGVKDA
jgi:hypothetical protein